MKIKLNIKLIGIFCLTIIGAQGFAQNKLVGEVPFKMHGAHVILTGSINGSEPFQFAFDTGAMGTFIDKGKAQEIGLEATGEMPVMGASGERKSLKLSAGNTISINGIEFKNTTLVMNDNSNSTQSGRIHDSVLGYEQLSQYVTVFDYDASVIRFYENDGYQYQGKGTAIDIDLGMRIPSIDISFTLPDNTRIDGRALIDTGASTAASLNTPVTEKYNLIENAENLVSKIGRGGTGSFVTVESRIKGISLGNHTFENVPVGLSSVKRGPKASNRFLGLVGNYILSRFNITFDYANSKMYLEPNSSYKNDFRVNCSGMQYAHYPSANGGFLVELVDKNSPADELGIKKGDELIKINGRSVTEYGYNELIKLMSTDGKKLKLEWTSNGKRAQGKLKLRKLI